MPAVNIRKFCLSAVPAAVLLAVAPTVPTASAGGIGGCGCAAPVPPGGTVDLEFAGCGCAPVAPVCAAPVAPVCAAPCGPVAPAYAAPVYTGACCDNIDYTRRPGCGKPGLFAKLWELEQRKNRFLFGKLCGLRDDCAPVYAPVCAPACDPCAAAVPVAPVAPIAPVAPVYAAPAGVGVGAPGCGCGH